MELPPRARRIRIHSPTLQACAGTTSACAENTAPHRSRGFAQRNYLRVRGEYMLLIDAGDVRWELPPRARRIHNRSARFIFSNGTTSACAENTHPEQSVQNPGRNYLRVRGEYGVGCVRWLQGLELPPRARRILAKVECVMYTGGTTSACAENTSTCGMTFFPTRNYLRVRGEYRPAQRHFRLRPELPPRARRIL